MKQAVACKDDIESYFERQIAWSRETFGPALRTKGVIDHITKELREIERDPHDLSEWVDVVILAMDGFWRHGGKAADLLPSLIGKQQKNMARKWPDWRTMSEDQAIEHDRTIAATVRITRRDLSAAILVATTANTVAIRAGTTIEIDGKSYVFEDETPVASGAMIAGIDYGVAIDEHGQPFVTALSGNPLSGAFIGGFHFAPGGNARDRSGGDTIPAINPYSLWDRDFRPACHDPRGMAIVERRGRLFWVDIYLLGVDHKEDGTSRFGVEIADGASLDLLDFKTASRILAEHGKRLLTHDEFCAAAFGVTEKSSSDDDPEKTGLDATRTSKFGLMQATGNLWIWGTDDDPDDPRPSLFGGSWLGSSGAGSRCAGLDCWPGSSVGSFSARGGSDHLSPA